MSELKEALERIAATLERIVELQEDNNENLDSIHDTLQDILANDRGTYNP